MRAAELRKNDLEKIFQNNPSTPYYAHLADCFLESDNSDELDRAVAILEIGIKNSPRDINGHFVLGKCYYKMGDIKNAKSELERTLKFYPNHMGAYKLLLELNEADGLTQVNKNLKSYIKIYDPLSEVLTETNAPIKPIDFSSIDSDVVELEDELDLIDTSVFDEQMNSADPNAEDIMDISDFEDVSEPEESIEALPDDEIDELQNEIGGILHSKKVNDLTQEDELAALFGDDEDNAVDDGFQSFEDGVEEKLDLEEVDFFSLSEEELFQDDPEQLEKIRERKGLKPAIVNEEKSEQIVSNIELSKPSESDHDIKMELVDDGEDMFSMSELDKTLENDDIFLEPEISEENLAEPVTTPSDVKEHIKNLDEDVFSMSELDDTLENDDIFSEPEIKEENLAEPVPTPSGLKEPIRNHDEDIFSMSELSDEISDDTIFEEKVETLTELETKKVVISEKPKENPNKRAKLSELPKQEVSDEPQILSARVLKPEDISENEITKLEDFVTDISEKQTSKPVETADTLPKNIFQDDLLSDELEMLNNDVTPKKLKPDTDDSALLSPTLGEIHMAQGRFEEAKDIFKKLLEKSPNDEKLKRKISDINDILGD